MPKPVKNSKARLPVPPQPKRASNPHRAADAKRADRLARGQGDPTPPAPTFEEQFRARMAELGRAGGKKSGEARMEKLTPKQRRDIAIRAASARWKDRSR